MPSRTVFNNIRFPVGTRTYTVPIALASNVARIEVDITQDTNPATHWQVSVEVSKDGGVTWTREWWFGRMGGITTDFKTGLPATIARMTSPFAGDSSILTPVGTIPVQLRLSVIVTGGPVRLGATLIDSTQPLSNKAPEHHSVGEKGHNYISALGNISDWGFNVSVTSSTNQIALVSSFMSEQYSSTSVSTKTFGGSTLAEYGSGIDDPADQCMHRLFYVQNASGWSGSTELDFHMSGNTYGNCGCTVFDGAEQGASPFHAALATANPTTDSAPDTLTITVSGATNQRSFAALGVNCAGSVITDTANGTELWANPTDVSECAGAASHMDGAASNGHQFTVSAITQGCTLIGASVKVASGAPPPTPPYSSLALQGAGK